MRGWAELSFEGRLQLFPGREAALLLLAEDQLVVELHLEGAVAGGHDHGCQQGGEVAKNLIQEGDRLREVVSSRAVGQAQGGGWVDHPAIMAL